VLARTGVPAVGEGLGNYASAAATHLGCASRVHDDHNQSSLSGCDTGLCPKCQCTQLLSIRFAHGHGGYGVAKATRAMRDEHLLEGNGYIGLLALGDKIWTSLKQEGQRIAAHHAPDPASAAT